MAEKIYEEEFPDRVIRAETPVLIDFYADWCGPCKMLAPVLEQLEDENDDYSFFKVNVDENPALAENYEVFSIPCLMIFKNGEPVDSAVGFQSAEQLQAFLDKNK